MIRNLQEEEYSVWLELAKEVEPLFGPMVQEVDFQSGIRKSIRSGNAFCVTSEEDIVVGIVAIDRINREIVWLAVKREFRNNHFGERLIQKAIKELGEDRKIHVQTFAPGIEVGESARRLYQKFGFVDFKETGKNPAGKETIKMVRI